jgi:hypothetical protein
VHDLVEIAYGADGQVKKVAELLEALVKAQETLVPNYPLQLTLHHTLTMAYQADRQVYEDD